MSRAQRSKISGDSMDFTCRGFVDVRRYPTIDTARLYTQSFKSLEVC